MKAYYEDGSVTIYHGDCREIAPDVASDVVVTDPPYNVGYHYESYSDDLSQLDYCALLSVITLPAVVIHYPEDMFLVSSALGEYPSECVAWTYNALTPRKWRMIAWFGCKPGFHRIRQPFKNLDDKRIVAAMENGSEGAAIYDWWHDEQVKNVSAEKTEHPCQIPIEVMKRVIGITVADVIIDPFMGSGTTLRAAKDLGRKAIGIEIEERYCEIAARRMEQEVLPLNAAQFQPEHEELELAI